jgi:D-alanyl-D-alanine carboxypeptidase
VALSASLKNPPPPEELLSYVDDEPLNFESGTSYEYSNSDNIVVGLIVEEATGEPYEQQPNEQDLKPLFIYGYDNGPSQDPPEDLSEVLASGWVWASGGVVTTPSELNDFARGYVGSAF